MDKTTDIEVAGDADWLSTNTKNVVQAAENPQWLTDNKNDAEKRSDPQWLTPRIDTTATATEEMSNSKVLTSNGEPTTPSVDDRRENRLSAADAASKKTWNEYFRETFKRDGRLLLITLGILICMNIPFVRWGLYSFSIFNVWIHEFCHGMAAVITGGSIAKLEIFAEGSGLATTSSTRRAFVASAGYQGTAFIGFLLLIFRRTKRGPRTGTMIVGCTMIISCLLWIRNAFGIVFILAMGVSFVGLAWMLPSTHIRNLYTIIAVTCSLNGIASITNLFGTKHLVNGEPVSSDAVTMAELVGGSHILWALIWLVLSIFLTIMGILFAIPGPDEVADFTCCGICQDFGLFNLCNFPGQRWCSKLRVRETDESNIN